jgi:hypothetical protein
MNNSEILNWVIEDDPEIQAGNMIAEGKNFFSKLVGVENIQLNPNLEQLRALFRQYGEIIPNDSIDKDGFEYLEGTCIEIEYLLDIYLNIGKNTSDYSFQSLVNTMKLLTGDNLPVASVGEKINLIINARNIINAVNSKKTISELGDYVKNLTKSTLRKHMIADFFTLRISEGIKKVEVLNSSLFKKVKNSK